MSKQRHRSYPDTDKREQKVKNQSSVIKGLEKEIKRLKAELQTLNAAFKKAAEFMSDGAKELSVEDLIKGAEKNSQLKEMQKEHELKQSAPEKRKVSPPSPEELEQRRLESLRIIKEWRDKNLPKYEEE